MPKISVKAVEGRVAFSAPRGGTQIPNDRFVKVQDTPWVRRLIEVHGDVVIEDEKKSKSKVVDDPKLL